MLVHMIQSTVDAPVELGGNMWSGIAVETCTTCHNRGRRIGVSYEGLMETPYPTPSTPTGEDQRKVHGKHYLRLSPDVHQRKGMACQDCHTSLDIHGANILVGSITAAVEIECTDCHGTTRMFPWELPLGWGDEYGRVSTGGRPRGTSPNAPAANRYGAGIDKRDGFLLTARGNPLENVVRDGYDVIVHLASGKAVRLKPLKALFEDRKLPLEGAVAMDGVARHVEKMECYACHSGWAPQCYGCHVKIDYSKSGTSPDWVEIGRNHGSGGLTSEDEPGFPRHRLAGNIKESRSFLRWEDPPLGVNGEGRVAPVIPGCQTTVTVIDRDGKPVIVNHVFRIPNVEGAGPEGQLAIDMAPLQPHTTQERARSCLGCHGSEKAAGYGIEGGRLFGDQSRPFVVEFTSPEGRLVVDDPLELSGSIEGLGADWSRFVTEEGKQLQTVGHHLPLSGPLSAEQRAILNRRGVCLACHRDIPGSIDVRLLNHVAAALGILPESDAEHSSLLRKTLHIAGWVQVAGPILVGVLLLFVFMRFRRKRAAGKRRRRFL